MFVEDVPGAQSRCKVIKGEAITRIYHEVLIDGITESTKDSAEERAYRQEIVEGIAKLKARDIAPWPINDPSPFND